MPTGEGGVDMPRLARMRRSSDLVGAAQYDLGRFLDDASPSTLTTPPCPVSPIACGAALPSSLPVVPSTMMCGDVCRMLNGGGPLGW